MAISAKILETLIKNIATAGVKKGFKKLNRTHKALLILKKLGLAKLEEDFGSIYAHALAHFGMDREPAEVLSLFLVPAIKKAYRQQDYRQKNAFRRLLEDQLHTNRSLIALKPHYANIDELWPQVEEFTQNFELLTQQASNPMMLNLYHGQMELLEENYKKSFEYQVEAYLKDRQADFAKEYLAENKYIPLHGETRRSKLMPERPAEKLENEEKEYEATPYEPIDLFVNNWLKDHQQRLLILMGEYGTGKTTFMRYLTHQLAGGYLTLNEGTSITDPKRRIPLYLPLRDFEDRTESFIQNACTNYGIHLDFKEFKDRLAAGELLVIFDGFDEMTQVIENRQKRANFNKLKTIVDASPNSKVILTCRKEYFPSEEEPRQIFGQSPNHSTLHLRPFNKEQIRQYLRTHTDRPDFFWRNIQNIFDLHDLAQRPVLLEFIVKYLPDILPENPDVETIVRASDLYRKCFDDELQRKKNELNFFVPEGRRLNILKDIAVWMFENDTLSFSIPELRAELNLQQYFQYQQEWEFERFLNEFLSFTFLIREADFRYRISHKSFRDYLTAVAWTEELKDHKINHFGRIKATEELQHFILEQGPDRDYLEELILTAKNLGEDRHWQGVNAANLLLKMDPTALRGKNLSDCHLPEVDFALADLRDTVLYKTHLNDGVFNRSLLFAATIQHCSFAGGELYYNFLTLEYAKKLHNKAAILKKLEQSLRASLGVGTLKEVRSLAKLDLGGSPLSDLNIFEEWTNLQYLYVSNTQVADLQPIAKLTNLQYLYVSNTQVADLQPIAKLTNLQSLDVYNTQVADLQPIAKLTNLQSLSVYNTQVADLQPIAKLTNLQSLRVSNTQVADLQPIAKLTNLQSLSVSNTQVADLQPIAKLTNLQYLYVSNTQVADLQPIAKLTNLQYLYVYNTQVADLQPIAKLTNLQSLYVYNTQVADLQPIAKLTNLQYLYVSNTQVADLQPIAKLTNLQYLYVSNTQVADLQPIAKLTNLQSLYVYNTQVADLQPIAKLTNLQSLYVYNTQVADLQPIAKLTNLQSLYVSNTQVADLQPIAKLTNLQSLKVSKGQFSEAQLRELKDSLPDLDISIESDQEEEK